MATCAHGHESEDGEYCDEFGHPVVAAPAPAGGAEEGVAPPAGPPWRATAICAHGHESEDGEYCDEFGHPVVAGQAPAEAGGAEGVAAPPARAAGTPAPAPPAEGSPVPADVGETPPRESPSSPLTGPAPALLLAPGRRPATGRWHAARPRILTGACVAALVLLFGTLAVATSGAREALRVIGHDAGPQVVASTELYFALSDMDAQVATILLMGADAEYDAPRQAAFDRYEEQRGVAGRALAESYELAAGDPEAQATIQSVISDFGRYEHLAGRALLLGEQADHAAGAPPEEVLEVYREATDLMRLEVLPQAYNLTLENGTIVRRTYDQTHTTVVVGRGVVAASSVLALGCLVGLQVFLARRFRRAFSPALLVATAVTAMYAYTGVTVLGTQAEVLSTAKHDGFDQVLSLSQARAVSNSLHADQSRYLIDSERADTYEQIYLDRAQSLVYAEAGNLESYYTELAGALPGEGGEPSEMPGLLGAAATGPAVGEGTGEEARAALAAFGELQEGDREMRELAAEGDDEAAVALRAGPLAATFQTYDAALADLTAIHQEVFEDAVADGEAALADLWFLIPVAMLSIAVVVVVGVVPRLAEYR